MNLKEDSLIEQFFKLPENTNPELVKVADIIKKQNSQSEFLSSFIKKNGLPKWEYTISNASISDGQSKAGHRNTNTHDSLLFFIPIQDINNKEINSYIVCLKADTTYKFKLYKKNELANVINPDPQKQERLESALSNFASFEKKINNKDSLFIAGSYNKLFYNSSISFGSGSSNAGRFYAYSITVCYETNYYAFRTESMAGGNYRCNTSWFYFWIDDVSIPYDDSEDPWSGGGGGVGGGIGGSYDPDFDSINYPETFEILQFENDYLNQMSTEELQIFDNMSRINQLQYLYNAKYALEKAKELYPNSVHNGNGDAFRHALFSGLNAKVLGVALAKLLGDAHELIPNTPTLENKMDLFNNQVGRDQFVYLQNQGQAGHFYKEALVISLMQKIQNGELIRLDPLDVNSQIIPGITHFVPTN